MSRNTLPRYIEPASIELGDFIRVVWVSGDIEHTRTAHVAKREYEGQMRVLYTRDGQEIFRWLPGLKNVRVTLLDKVRPLTQSMLDMFEGRDHYAL